MSWKLTDFSGVLPLGEEDVEPGGIGVKTPIFGELNEYKFPNSLSQDYVCF